MKTENHWIVKGFAYMTLVLCAVLSVRGDVIIDNGDTGTSFTGIWEVSGGSDAYGADSVWSRNGASYSWQTDNLSEGRYEVLMWWSAWASRAPAAEVSVEHAEGSDVLLVNQQVAGGQWNSLGTYPFKGSGKVTIIASTGATISTCADAVWFKRVNTSDEIVIDNRDEDKTSKSGTWEVSTAEGAYEADSVWGRDGSTFTWHFTPPATGDYEVSMWWTEWSSRSAAAPVDILHAGGTERVKVNQRTNGGQWNPIGTYTFTAGSEGTVTLVAEDGSPTSYCADAVKFTLIHATEAPAAEINKIHPNPAMLGKTVSFEGKGSDSDGHIVEYSWESSLDGHLSDAAEFKTDKLSEGVHEITFKVKDDKHQWSPPAAATLTISAKPVEVIVDNRDRDTRRNGKWPIADTPGCYGEDSAWARNGATFTWYFTPPLDGDYEVSMWWTEWDSRSDAAPIDIRHADGKERVFVNQKTNGGRWNSLGVYPFKGDVRYSVTLWARGGYPTTFCADAVKFTPVDWAKMPVAVIDTLHPNPAAAGEAITFEGHGTVAEGQIVAYKWESSIDGDLSDAAAFSTDTISEGDHDISFKVQDDAGQWSAAAKLKLTVHAGPSEKIIDNGDTATAKTGTWEVSEAPGAYGADAVWSRDGATFTWKFKPNKSGDYEVSMWWTEWESRSDSVPVEIKHAAGTKRVKVNQKTNGGKWNLLGVYPLKKDVECTVTLTAEGSAPLSYCADAVKFTHRSANKQPLAIIDLIKPNPVKKGEKVTFRGHGRDPDGKIVAYRWTSSIDGHLSDSYHFTTDTLSKGVHEITFEVQDKAGRWSEAAVKSLTVEGGDMETIIDNRDAKTSRKGKWQLSRGPDCHGPDSAWGCGGAAFTWHFTPPTTGDYEVAMWWTEKSSRSSAAGVDIVHAGGTKKVTVDQKTNGGRWNVLGVYAFDEGVEATVTLWAEDKYPTTYCADAVKFSHVDSLDPPLADFHADSTRGPAPYTVHFTNETAGKADEWLWDFGDGTTSTEKTPSHAYRIPGVHTVSLKAMNGSRTHTKTRYSYVDIKAKGTENIYVVNGYAGNDFLVPDLTKRMHDMGAQKTAGGWVYNAVGSPMTYNISVVHDKDAAVNAFYEEGSHIVIAGHGNFGFGLVFADPDEIRAHTIRDYRYVDDDRLLNYSTDWVSTKVDGMKYGQMYPNWEPVFKDGRSALMPYEFGDPRGNPPYNYYLTYQVPDDPTHYRIEIDGSYVERFPDSGVPAWYSAQGLPPDPKRNPEFYITNPDLYYNRFDCTGEWAIHKVSNGGFLGEVGYMGYNYQATWPGTGSKVAVWTMVLPQAGEYEVLANWPASPENATNAQYIVHHAGGSTVVLANQTTTSRRNSLGVYNFQAGVTKVELNDKANGRVVADAIILRPVVDAKKILKAEFSADSTSGSVPMTVKFQDRSHNYTYDYSTRIKEWHWDFGDGETSGERHPSHTYAQAGAYTVTLRIVDSEGDEDTETKAQFVVVDAKPQQPQAEFWASVMQGIQKTHVSFYDQSSGDINQWYWDFGDGTTSNEKNPVHLYTKPGIYTVRLTVAGPGGSHTATEEDYIHNCVGESYTDNTFQVKPHFYSRGYSTFGMVMCYAGTPSVDKGKLRYCRLYHGSCGSFMYFGTTFDRGLMYGKSGVTQVEHDTAVDYLEYYLKGYTDEEIVKRLNKIENIHHFYNFAEKPLSMH